MTRLSYEQAKDIYPINQFLGMVASGDILLPGAARKLIKPESFIRLQFERKDNNLYRVSRTNIYIHLAPVGAEIHHDGHGYSLNGNIVKLNSHQYFFPVLAQSTSTIVPPSPVASGTAALPSLISSTDSISVHSLDDIPAPAATVINPIPGSELEQTTNIPSTVTRIEAITIPEHLSASITNGQIIAVLETIIASSTVFDQQGTQLDQVTTIARDVAEQVPRVAVDTPASVELVETVHSIVQMAAEQENPEQPEQAGIFRRAASLLGLTGLGIGALAVTSLTGAWLWRNRQAQTQSSNHEELSSQSSNLSARVVDI